MFRQISFVHHPSLRKAGITRFCRAMMLLLLLFCVQTARAQNISWFRWDNTNNSSDFPNYSEALDFAKDSAGNSYFLINFLGEISVGDGADQQLVNSDGGAATVIVKHDPDGNLLWHKLYPFLSNRRIVMDASRNGNVIIVAEVRGNSDITFEGQTFNLDPLTDYLFTLWLGPDGDLINWRWDDQIFEDFQLEELVDVLLLDDLTYWLSGGYAKEQFGENFTRHDIEFISRFDADGDPIQRNHFDPGERGEEEVDYILLDKFQEVNDAIYIPAYGNGFYGLDDGDRSAFKYHGYILSINEANTLDLQLGITDANDNMHHALPHEGGGFSLLIRKTDGILNTTNGDFDIGPGSQNRLVHINGNTLISVMDLPEMSGDLIKVEDHDHLVAMRARAFAGDTYTDGYGGILKVPEPGGDILSFVAIYDIGGKMEFMDFFLTPDSEQFAITELSIDNPCDGFTISGWSLGATDINLGQGTDVFTPNYAPSQYYYVDYENEPPEVTVQEEFGVCPGSELFVQVIISDEFLSRIAVSVEAPNGDFDPGQMLIEGQGTYRYLNLSNVDAAGDYTVRLRVEDACGDVTEKDIIIRHVAIPDAPVLSEAGEYMLCTGDTLRLTATAAHPLLWSDGTEGDTLKIFEAGGYWASQVAGGSCQGPNSDTLRVVMVANPEMPEITTNSSLVLCPGETITLTASLTERLVWSTGESTQSISINEPGIYSVYQTSEHCGNSEASRVEVRWTDVLGAPTIEVVGNAEICEGGEVLLRSSAGPSSRWSNGAVGEEIIVNVSGAYTVNHFDGDCDGLASEPVNISVAQPISIELVHDTTICDFFEPLELTPAVSEPDLDFLWSDGSTSSSLIVNEPGEYWVEVSNGACVEVARVTVTELCLPSVHMPNAFSPNGDGENDSYGPVGQRVVDFQMIIYNQWGRTVFVSRDINRGWDGTVEGKEAPMGKYVYKVTYNGLINGELISYSQNGRLQLIR